MTPEQLAAERAAFEAQPHIRKLCPFLFRRRNGGYLPWGLDTAWKTWLAAKEHAARERALDELVANSQAIGGYEATADGMPKR